MLAVFTRKEHHMYKIQTSLLALAAVAALAVPAFAGSLTGNAPMFSSCLPTWRLDEDDCPRS